MATITNVSLVTVYVNDQTEAKQWYIDKLGFVETADVTMGDHGFRWVTVAQPDHPELELAFMVPGPPLDDNLAEAIRRALANGTHGAVGLNTDDCQKAYEELTAKGVEFVQPPSERPYGVEAVMRDNSGNWLVLVEKREYDPKNIDWSTDEVCG
ncbi:VOC family protein [Nocardia transvalensis]|uniref:VOC family protein n=1 Tax=Nocardia transvalensis TaxID=37333 RepID=UPI001895ECAF|nr:VOC family protein [Nocardia transvalensis]MBF6333704.1 VOC family protein [Nocardia transvalensis]